MEFFTKTCCKSGLVRSSMRTNRIESRVLLLHGQLTVEYGRLLPAAGKGTKVVADFPKQLRSPCVSQALGN